MKVAMLVSNAVDPDPRVEKEAAALAAAGHEVTVIAWDRAGSSEARVERDGYAIERVGPRAAYGGGLASIGLFREFWRTAATRAIELRADVVHSHDTDTIPAGLSAIRSLGRSGSGARFVVDFHELYRASRMVPQAGVVGVLARAWVDRLERKAVRAASLVIVANEGVLPHYEAMGAGSKLLFVPNAPDADLFVPMPCAREIAGEVRPFTVTFIGRKRYAATLEALADAIQPHPDMAVELVGGGPDAARVDSLAMTHERVTASGPIPYAGIPARYACTDVVHAAYDAVVGNARVCTPGKVFEAMACSKPVIVSAGTWIGEWVERKGVGLAVDATDVNAVEAALTRLRDQPELRASMGVRGRTLVESGLNWESAARDLVAGYARIA